MHHQQHTDALPIDFHRNRIDQEWHVVVDEFNDRTGGFEAMLRHLRIEDAHFRRAGVEFLTKTKMRERQCAPGFRIAHRQIIRIDAAAIFSGKGLHMRALCRRYLACGQFSNLGEERGFLVFCFVGHIDSQ